MMRSLERLQRDVIDAVAGDGGRISSVAPGDGIDFYRALVQGNRGAALAATYPVVERLVGRAFFAHAARSYASRYPTSRGDLNAYGGGFDEFLAAYPPAAGLAYLPDVARLEWRVHASEQAAAPPFDFDGIACIPAERYPALRAILAPSARWLSSPFPIFSLWQANQPGRDGTVEADAHGEDVLVWRMAGQAPEVARVDQATVRLLEALACGEPLSRAAQALGAEADRLPALLAAWARDGVVTALRTDDASA